MNQDASLIPEGDDLFSDFFNGIIPQATTKDFADRETFRAENTDEIVWLRLNRLKSVKLCEKLIRKKLAKSPNPNITEDVIKAKAVGLSSAIKSAIGYWQVKPQSINAKVLSLYYFLLQMTIAEQVSSVRNTDDLKTVQKHTENGHGLGTISAEDKDFPENYFTFAIRSGHFYSYSKFLGINLSTRQNFDSVFQVIMCFLRVEI